MLSTALAFSATPNGTVFRKQSAKLLVSVFRAAKFQPKLKKSCLTLKSHGEEFPTSQICVTNFTDFFDYKSSHVHVEICKIKKRDRRKQNSYFVYLHKYFNIIKIIPYLFCFFGLSSAISPVSYVDLCQHNF